MLAARIRESFGLPGLSVAQTVPFRDKERMKQAIDAAGIRTPRHAAATSVHGVWEAAERIGYPLIVKPIAGAGAADTYRIDGPEELSTVLPLLRHVPEVSVEEFIDGEEFTYDTICANGAVLFENMLWYRPRPLQMKQHEWISPVSLSLRDLDVPDLRAGREMGTAVIAALGFTTGFTHMEWYRKDDGEAVFGEIGARVAGARVADLMNYATDGDVYIAWAEAVVHGRLSKPLERRYNAGAIFKRAQGAGAITRVEGLEKLLTEYGDAVAMIDLLPIGAQRRDWQATVTSDGTVIVRHPELQRVIEMTERFAADLQIYAG
jgi:biotin carboxylase